MEVMIHLNFLFWGLTLGFSNLSSKIDPWQYISMRKPWPHKVEFQNIPVY